MKIDKYFYLINEKQKIVDSEGYLREKDGKRYLVNEKEEYQNFVDYDWAILVSTRGLIESYLNVLKFFAH